ncbi:MAG: hypothetical protein IME93_05270 [Proteobacteria bacterium]|nr:hypothetical protein [Pseudomonadota bacterium]
MHQETTSLAKITRPGLPEVYERDRLFKTLDEGRERQLIWVGGPPGAGKTTLVCSYIEKRNMSCIWYQVDKEDNDLGTLFHYLGIAGKQAAPRKRKLLPHLTPEFRRGLVSFARKFFQELGARLTSPYVIVLDNYQELDPQSDLHGMLREGANSLPDGGCIIAISRTDPPPELARDQANQSMAVLGWQDLSLKQDETEAVAKLLGSRRPIDEVVKQLHDKASGWVAGLVLLLGSSKDSDVDLSSLSSPDNDSLYRYFANEIFGNADKTLRQFLMKSALLPNMTVDMAKTLTGINDAGEYLSKLNQQHSFTEKREGKSTIYQYHPLFREFLLAQAEQTFKGAELTPIKWKAAELLEEDGQLEAAMQLHSQIRNWSRFVPLVCKHAGELLKQGRGQTLLNWLKELPGEVFSQHAWLSYWQGAATMPFNLVAARDLLIQAHEQFSQSGDVDGICLSWSTTVDSYIYEWGNFSELDHWIERLQEIKANTGLSESPEIVARLTASMFSALMYRQPAHPDFPSWEQAARKLIDSNLSLALRISLGNHLMLYYSWLGDLAKAGLIMEILRSGTKQADIEPLALIIWRSMEGMYHWLSLQNEQCLKAIEDGLEIAQASGVRLWDFMLYAQGMYGAINSNNLIKGAELLEHMASSMHGNRRLDAAHYHYQAASLALAHGNLPKAMEHAQAAADRTDEAASPFPQTLTRLGLSQVLFERGEHEAAERMLDTAYEMNHMHLNSQFVEYHVHLLRAYYANRLEDNKRALELLRKAFLLAKQYGFFTMTWWRPDMMTRLCTLSLLHDIEAEFARDLIQRQQLLPEEAGPEIESWPWVIKVFTLNRLSILINNKPLQSEGRTKSKPLELLKVLIALGGNNVSEVRIVEALWPDAEGDAAHSAFDTTLHRLRKLIGNDRAISLQDGRVTLSRRHCWVDTWALESTLDTIEQQLPDATEPAAEQLTRKLFKLYPGQFLADSNDSSWAFALRDRLHSRVIRQFSAICQHWNERQQWETLVDLCRRILEIEPLAEEFYQTLISAYLKLGRRAEAITTYQRCERHFESALNIPPSKKTQELLDKSSNNQ